MRRSREKPWLERQRLPDPQVRDAAEQYDAARRLLQAEGPSAGVFLPLLNAAVVPLELYLKSLASERVHQFWSFVPAIWKVHAEPKVRSHTLGAVFDAIPEDIRATIEQEFALRGVKGSTTFRQALEKYEGLFRISRYPFEIDADIRTYPLEPLLRLVDFLGAFVAALPKTERIQLP
jgi:hypothetical protein